MAGSMIPDDVTTLLRDCIESFEQLELLLLLRRRQGDTWTLDSVASELNLASDVAASALDHLRRWNLVEREARVVRYKPVNPGMEAAVQGLAEAYEEQRLEVIKLMNKNAIERVRTSAMRAFADAFFVGGEGKKKDG